MRKSLFLLVMSIAMLAAGPVFAQESAEDVAYKEELSKMMKLSGTLAASENMVPQMVEMIKQSAPNVPTAFWDEFVAKWKKKMVDKVVELYVPIYKKYLTLDDLKKIVAFYESPVGKKLGEATPKMTMEGMQLGQKLGMEIVNEIQKELEAKGYK